LSSWAALTAAIDKNSTSNNVPPTTARGFIGQL
jgi:hypothetical protein